MKSISSFMAFPSALRRKGVLGINARNAQYTMLSNPRKYYPRVDNKLNTKSLCQQHGISVPATYGIIDRFGQTAKLAEIVSGLKDFVIKPASGAAGRGIMVIVNNTENSFETASGTCVSIQDLRYHISSILSGLFSLGGRWDQAIIERRIIRHSIFDKIAVRGTPDIRVIVYKGVPIMAMLRLPTLLSNGRANLHQGAIAAGIDLTTGLTQGGVWKNSVISIHPETGASVVGIQIPFWTRIIQTSVQLYEILELGYFGVDFVLDIKKGPVILEANARPGLSIQIANRLGLLHRIQAVDKNTNQRQSQANRIAFADEISHLD